MAHPFDGIRLKIERAEENLKNLGSEVAAFIAKHYRVTEKRHGEAGKQRVYVYIETTGTPVDLARLSVLVGEIIYQLRSSLDHAFWELIDGDPLEYEGFRRFTFPLCKTEGDYRSQRGDKEWRLIGDAEAIVKGLQPYQRGDDYWRDPLWILNELSVIDRHRLLTTTLMAADLPSGDPRWRWMQTFHHDTPLALSWDPTQEVDVKGAAVLAVQLGKDWPRFDQPLPKILEYMIGATKEVVNALAKVIDPPGSPNFFDVPKTILS